MPLTDGLVMTATDLPLSWSTAVTSFGATSCMSQACWNTATIWIGAPSARALMLSGAPATRASRWPPASSLMAAVALMLWRSTFAPAFWNSPACCVIHTGALPVTFWLEARRTAAPLAAGFALAPAEAPAAAGFALAAADVAEALTGGLAGGADGLGAVLPDAGAGPPQAASVRMAMADRSPLARVRCIPM